MNNIREIVEKLNNAKKIAVLYHINADGDAVGSALALLLAFSSSDRIVHIYGEEEVQKNLRFLPSSDSIILGSSQEKYDAAISLDAGSIHRLGSRQEIYNSADVKINIDHHKSNDTESDVSFIDINAAASGELVYKIINEAGIEITKEIATCLFVAISTDCGSFRFSNTSPQTHRIAAELMEAGADSSEISKKVYDSVPPSKIRLLGKVLDSMDMQFDGKVSILAVTSQILKDCGAVLEEADNIANYGTSIEGVEVAMFLKETGENVTRVSLRSKNYFDCSEFAKNFGGGGHVRAAGCTIETSVDEAKKILLDKVKEFGI